MGDCKRAHTLCMEPHILTRKRSKCVYQDSEPSSKAKKPLLDTDRTDKTEVITQQSSCGDPGCPQNHTEGWNEALDLSQLISVWSDTQCIGNKALNYLQTKETTEDILLKDSVNKKFLEFHHDITEECGAEDKQHSWAVIEKKEEVVMYGPYYPNYNKGEHSEDIIIRQTDQLLGSRRANKDWKVYVFTMNSPCLCRTTETPCMLKLVLKAKEWWLKFRVKTNIGYKKCWGFKGTKETTFRVINYNQVQAVKLSESYEEYVSGNLTGVNMLSGNVFALLKNMLKSGPVRYDLSLHGIEWKSYFKGMLIISESLHEPDKGSALDAICSLTEAAKSLSEKCLSLEEHLAKGQAFTSDYSFKQEMTESTKSEIRSAFLRCWGEMVQDRYTEELRDALTDNFNKCTNQMFIRDFVNVTSSFLHIGRVCFKDEAGTES